MTKILFIENRFTTKIFEEIEKRLTDYEIFWIVQNHIFKPLNSKNVFLIKYPSKKDLEASNSLRDYKNIIPADRGVNFFGVTKGHYNFYFQEIEKIIDGIKPSIVFGETTQFHELISEHICSEKNIPYLHPTASRIPPGRIHFFKGKTMESIRIKEHPIIIENKYHDLMHSLKSGDFKTPTHTAMNLKSFNLFQRFFLSRIKVLIGYLMGERFITPAPFKKVSLDSRLRRTLKIYENYSSEPKSDKKYILYPMQMQPETNIDIWGQPWNDQTNLIGLLADNLKNTGYEVLVKVNPKTKYEILNKSFSNLLKRDDITFLPVNYSMDKALEKSKVVLSVTGSIIMECIFTGKPVIVLGDHAMSMIDGVNKALNIDEIVTLLNSSSTFVTEPNIHGKKLLENNISNSYEGKWFDPTIMDNFKDQENLDKLEFAFRDIIRRYE